MSEWEPAKEARGPASVYGLLRWWLLYSLMLWVGVTGPAYDPLPPWRLALWSLAGAGILVLMARHLWREARTLAEKGRWRL